MISIHTTHCRLFYPYIPSPSSFSLLFYSHIPSLMLYSLPNHRVLSLHQVHTDTNSHTKTSLFNLYAYLIFSLIYLLYRLPYLLHWSLRSPIISFSVSLHILIYTPPPSPTHVSADCRSIKRLPVKMSPRLPWTHSYMYDINSKFCISEPSWRKRERKCERE